MSRRSQLLGALWALGSLARVAAPQATRATLDSAEVRRWREDLAFLAREMPAQHANLFHTVRREQFDSAVAELSGRLPSLQRHEVIASLMRLAAVIGDGHTNVSPWRDTVVAFHTLPVALYRFHDGYFVRAASQDHRDLLGARVLGVGPVSIDSAESLVARLIGRDNAMGIWMYAPLLLRMPEVLNAVGLSPDATSAELRLDVGGTVKRVTLAASGVFPNFSGDADKSWNVPTGWVDLREQSSTPLWLSRPTDTYWFTYVPDGRVLYCQINEIQEHGEKLQVFMTRALHVADSVRADRFVLDLRLNGGGNGYYNRTIVRALVRSRFDERGRLFVVTSRRTFSAAQMLISDLEKWSNPIFVGEPSASRGNAYGDSRRLMLPNHRVTLRVSTLWWQYWDPRETRPWIAPEVAAPLTSAEYASGRDPALEAIVRFVPQPSLVEQLKPALLSRDSSAALQVISRFRSDPLNAWIDVSESLAELQDVLQSEGKTDASALAGRLRARLTISPPSR